jgi:uncharacterized membrane protein (UPF0127 family)
MWRWFLALALVVAACSDEAATETTGTPTADTTITEDSAATDAGTGTSPAGAPASSGAVATTDSGAATADAPSADEVAPRIVPEGFSTVGATVTAADGTPCEICLWLAATTDERSLGLMFATELGGPDGMAFVYPEPHSGSFWMKNTVMPLSIAFFDPDGAYLDSFDMEPCTADPCPPYPTPAGFTVAIETERGGLEELGIGPGSTLELDDLPCPIAP